MKITVVTPTAALIKGGYPAAIRDWLEKDSSQYDEQYGVTGVAKGDAGVSAVELENVLGLHQRMMAARREAALADATVSLFRRLMDPDLAEAYDATYGRPASPM